MILLALLAAQWSVHEIELSARGRYANPARDVTVIADFSGPEQVTVQGFWESGTRYKVRFTPSLVGAYKYKIRSHPTDIGLAAEGAFEAGPPRRQTGFVSADRPSWGSEFTEPGCAVTRRRLDAGGDFARLDRMVSESAIAQLRIGDTASDLDARYLVKRYAAFPSLIWLAPERLRGVIAEADPWAAIGRISSEGILVMDRRTLWTAALAKRSGTLADASLCADLGRLTTFLQGIPTDRMTPARGFIGMSDGDREFVVYSPNGDFPRTLTRRKYSGEVLDLRDGGRKAFRFVLPRGEDWVVHLKAK